MPGNRQPPPPPTESEQFRFANSLYNSIWQKFGAVASAQGTSTDSTDVTHCHEDIFRAVVCEQLLLRDFLKNHFFCFQSSLLQNPDSVFRLCRVICNNSSRWEFFQRLVRCSALIAEFFLYRHSRSIGVGQLYRAPMIWTDVFAEHFANDFNRGRNRGWDGFIHFSRIYEGDLYDPLDNAISRMTAPDDNVPPHCLQILPWMELPMTDPLGVYKDMLEALKCSSASMYRSTETPGCSSKSQNGNQVAECLSSPNIPSSSSQRLGTDPPQDLEVLSNILSEQHLGGGVVGTSEHLKAPDVMVTPATPTKLSPDTEQKGNLPIESVTNSDDPADSTLQQEAKNPVPVDEIGSGEETSPSKDPEDEPMVEDAPPRSTAAPDSKSKKRSNLVLEASDDIEPPSPKQRKPDPSV